MKKDTVSHQVESGIIEVLQAYKKLPQEQKMTGYLLKEVDKKTQFVLSLSGTEGKGIYLYASFYQVNRLRLLHRISCGLLFFSRLIGTVFDEKENRLLQELVQERYDLSIQQRAKAHSHTQDQELVDYYTAAFSQVSSGQSPPAETEQRPSQVNKDSDVMCLVSDLIISNTYRSSLSEDFYLPGVDVGSIVLREELKGDWMNESCLTMRLRTAERGGADEGALSHNGGRSAYVELKLHFPEDSGSIEQIFGSSEGLYSIGKKDRVQYLQTPIGIIRVPLYLLALARNAMKDEIRQGQTVDVYFVKTADHNLRIANKVLRDQIDSPEVTRRKYLDKPPANVEDGISLWSVSRYIQAIVASYLSKRLEDLQKISCTDGEFSKQAQRFVELYQKLTSQEFALQVTCMPVQLCSGQDEETFFCIDLPLLTEKYNLLEGEEEKLWK